MMSDYMSHLLLQRMNLYFYLMYMTKYTKNVRIFLKNGSFLYNSHNVFNTLWVSNMIISVYPMSTTRGIK